MKTVVIVCLALACGAAQAKGGHSGGAKASGGSDHAIKGYTKKDGTYVAPSHATNPNHSKADNFDSKGNTNPYTGKAGTKDPEKAATGK